MTETTAGEMIAIAIARRAGYSVRSLQAELLAEGRRVTQSGIRAWLRGESVPSDTYRLALVSVLGLDRDRFLSACAREGGG